MKVEVKEAEDVSENTYPKLMIDSDKQIIFVVEESGNHFKGVYLCDLDDKKTFAAAYWESWQDLKPFNGSVTLSND